MPSALIVVTYILAVARITRLITHDVITEPIRSALLNRFDPSKRIHRLAVYALGDMQDDPSRTGCPWCVSVWVSAASAPFVVHWQHETATVAILLALAASHATGLIAEHSGRQS